jgi:hypothetical protein
MLAKRDLRSNALVLSLLTLLSVMAFATDLHAEPAACAAYLTAAEVEAAVGVRVETAEPVEYSEGFTVCSWVKDLPEGQLGVSLSFFNMKAIREGMMSAESIPEYFDLQVASTREQGGKEPVKLEGYGKRAVLFSDEYLLVVMMEMEKGFVHLALSASDITRKQIEALAKAVASREKK